MAQATDLNTMTPLPDASGFRMQMEGLSIAVLYVACFGWVHLGAPVEFMSVRVLAVFLSGLIVIPLLTGLPIVFLRRMMMGAIKTKSSVSAFAPFARFALYGLQALLIWVATREAYTWIFTESPLA